MPQQWDEADFLKAAQATIDYMRVNEPNFVEGELVRFSRPSTIQTNANSLIRIVPGTLGVIVIEWRDTYGGLEANCFIMGVSLLENPDIMATSPYLDRALESVDPVWSQAPKRPYSLGAANYDRFE